MIKLNETIIREYNSIWELDLIQFMVKDIWSVDFLREMVERAGQGPKGKFEIYLKELINNMDRGVPYIIFGSNSAQMVCNAINYIKYCKILNKDLKLDLYKLDVRYRYLMAYNSGKPQFINPDTIHINFLKNFPIFY